MNRQITFEYYSTFAPVSDPFAADSPVRRQLETDIDIQPLQLIDNSYVIYSRIAYQPIIAINRNIFK